MPRIVNLRGSLDFREKGYIYREGYESRGRGGFWEKESRGRRAIAEDARDRISGMQRDERPDAFVASRGAAGGRDFVNTRTLKSTWS